MNNTELSLVLGKMIETPELIEDVRQHMENTLVEFRDSRLSFPNHGNGLVIYESDGEPSHFIRMSTQMAIKYIIKKLAESTANYPTLLSQEQL